MKKIIYLNPRIAKSLFNQIILSLIFLALTTLYMNRILEDDIFFKFFEKISLIGIMNIKIIIKFFIWVLSNILVYLLLKNIGNLSSKDYFKPTNISFIDIFNYTSLLIFGSSIIIFFLMYLKIYIPIDVDIIYPIGLNLGKQYFSNYIYLFLFIFICPFFEELIFRGVFLKFLGRFGYKFSVLTSMLIYTLFHQKIIAILISFFISFILAKITIRYKSVQPAIIIHILLNLFFALFYIVSEQYYGFMIILTLCIYFFTIRALIYGRIKIIKLKKNKNTKKMIYNFFVNPYMFFLLIILIIYPIFDHFFI